MALAWVGVLLLGALEADVCDRRRTVGLDVEVADTVAVAYFCRGQGQTFEAVDSLIASITVWSPPRSFSDYQARWLYVVPVNEYDHPATAEVIYGPQPLVNLTIDVVRPIEYRWTFDPPLRLPSLGKYALIVQADDGNAFELLAQRVGSYDQGMSCWTGPIVDCRHPGGPTCFDPAGWDLCFKVEFCSSQATAVRHRRWGELKRRYR